MHHHTAVIFRLIVALWVILPLSVAGAAPAPEDRYIATRDAAVAKFLRINAAGKSDDAARKAEDAVLANLKAQMSAILRESDRKGFGPAKLNLETISDGNEGFGTLDGLRFDSELGSNGEKAGGNGSDGTYVEPRAHIIVTTQTLFERWLRAHKEWWGKANTVPQRIGAALKDESFYTQAIQTDAAVIHFDPLPITGPASATFVYGFLGGRSQSDFPDAADEVFVSVVDNGKVYLAYGTIVPQVRVASCLAARAAANEKAEDADNRFRSGRIDKKAYDKLGDLRQQGEDAYKRCFTQRAPEQASFADAVRQAQTLLDIAIGK